MGASDCILIPSVRLAKISKMKWDHHFSIGYSIWNSDCIIGSKTPKSMWLHYLFTLNSHWMIENAPRKFLQLLVQH